MESKGGLLLFFNINKRLFFKKCVFALLPICAWQALLANANAFSAPLTERGDSVLKIRWQKAVILLFKTKGDVCFKPYNRHKYYKLKSDVKLSIFPRSALFMHIALIERGGAPVGGTDL